MLSFDNKKSIRFVITMQNGTFGSSSNNQVTLEGFRATVDIDKAGGMMMGTLRAQIYGVSQSNMNSVTTTRWMPDTWQKNTIQVYAIDGTQETLVFQGNIVNAWGNYENMPDVFLQIQAQSAYAAQLEPAAPLSFKGSIDAATLMAQIAGNMGLTFENNGVSVQLSNPYLSNTSLEQAKALARAANIDLYIDGNILAITPRNTPRAGAVPQVSPQTGLKGYPMFDGIGVNFQMRFNPAVTFGGSIQLVTSIPRAAGNWIVVSLSYKLDSEKPGGSWFAAIRGNKSGLALT